LKGDYQKINPTFPFDWIWPFFIGTGDFIVFMEPFESLQNIGIELRAGSLHQNGEV
jgi:hypothetical protein